MDKGRMVDGIFGQVAPITRVCRGVPNRRWRAGGGRWQAAKWVVFLLVILAGLAVVLGGCSDPLAKARDAEAAGDFSSAVSLYELRLQEEPDDLEALRAVTAILFVQQRFDEVLPYQERLVSLDPKDVQTRIELGFNYLSHQGQPVKAVATFREVTELEASAKHLTFLAQAQRGAGDLQAAEATLRQAIKLDGSYGYAYRVLIALLEADGRASEAEEVRRMAVENGVDTEIVNAL